MHWYFLVEVRDELVCMEGGEGRGGEGKGGEGKGRGEGKGGEGRGGEGKEGREERVGKEIEGRGNLEIASRPHTAFRIPAAHGNPQYP